jgi:anaerobic dimethyl sulfoxide reductase subunit C (anchor subunit)
MFVLGVIAMIVSLFHLGTPLHAMNAILNLGSSWLSREILFFALFMVCIFLYCGAMLLKKPQFKKPLAVITVIIGICSLISTAMVYYLPSIVAWYSFNTIVAFALTAVLVGVPLTVGYCHLDPAYERTAVILVIVAALVTAVSQVVYLTSFASGIDVELETFAILISSPLFWIGLACLVIGAVYGLYLLKSKTYDKHSTMYVLTLLFLIGAVANRILFYSSIVRM